MRRVVQAYIAIADRKPPVVGRGRGRGRDDGTSGRLANEGNGRGGRGKGGPGGRIGRAKERCGSCYRWRAWTVLTSRGLKQLSGAAFAIILEGV
ncbi:hypothetical protein Tco_1547852 [Tanacetum coccineum]